MAVLVLRRILSPTRRRLMLRGISPSAFDRLKTYSERLGATAAVLVMIGFGLVSVGEPIWRIMRTVFSN